MELTWRGVTAMGGVLKASVFACLLLVGCGDDSAPVDVGPDALDGGVDAGDDSGFDAGPPCMSDAECDDGVSCTRDLCDRGVCLHRDDIAMCDDGIFCNGMERCDRILGRCVAGDFQSCNDMDVCTIDRCDEEAKICRHAPRDFDEDGEADWNCTGGTDCDDRDPTRSTSVAEVCGDSIDNDCDELVDEATCGRPDHDACDDALDISAGGFFEVSTVGARPDHDLGCAPTGRPDVVFTFTLDSPKDVTLRAEGGSLTYAALRTVCDSRADQLECVSGFPGQVRSRALAAGTYYVLVADIGGDLALEALFDEPTDPPSNEQCDAPLDISAGGHFEGSFVDVGDELMTRCTSGSAPDLVYAFTLEEERDVSFAAASEGGTVVAEVQQPCGGDSLRCVRGRTAAGRLHRAQPGTYYLVVEGPGDREVDFGLDISFDEPSEPPAGDLCTDALPLVPGEEAMGTLRDKQDDIETSCGFFYRDAVHSFELTERSDVTLEASGAYLTLALLTECGGGEELRCRSGSPARTVARDLSPGTYYVVVESSSAGDYALTLDVQPPTPVVDVSGNDTCETAWEIPAAGGFFRGSTDIAIPDYETRSCGASARSKDVAFRLELDRTQRVVAHTGGSGFDTVLHLHSDSCMSEGEVACDDDGGDGSASRIDRTLEAGIHFLIVDGWGSSNQGDYFLEVQVLEP